MDKFRLFLYYYLPPLLWAGLIFFLSNIPDLKTTLPNTWDLILRKTAHLAEFGILAVLLLRMFLVQKKVNSPKNKIYLKEAVAASIVLSILYAFSDEFHQAFVVGRHGSFGDVGIDTIGILVFGLIYFKRRESCLRLKFH